MEPDMMRARFAFAFVVSACATPLPEEQGPVTEDLDPTHVHGDELEEGVDPAEVELKAGGCGQRWSLPADVAASGRSQSVGYDGAGSRCSGGATDGALVFADYLRENFDRIVNSSIPGDGVQLYNCRQVRGGRSLSVHAVGRALDVFVATQGGRADNAKGDQLANWLVENAEAIGVQAIIWDRTTWRPGRGDSCYTGAHPHNDHIHIELSREAASKDTPFFNGALDRRADAPAAPESNISEPVPSEPSPGAPPPAAAPVGPDSALAFVGTPCSHDDDCGFSSSGTRARCMLELNPTNGVCTLDCAGFCPDRAGFATTFCADTADLGGFGGGACLPRADERARCFGGLSARTVDRFVGRSSAPEATRTVCAPL
jgi:hypothetical protein